MRKFHLKIVWIPSKSFRCRLIKFSMVCLWTKKKKTNQTQNNCSQKENRHQMLGNCWNESIWNKTRAQVKMTWFIVIIEWHTLIRPKRLRNAQRNNTVWNFWWMDWIMRSVKYAVSISSSTAKSYFRKGDV